MSLRQSRREFIEQTLGVPGTLGLTVPFSQLTRPAYAKEPL